MCVFFFLKLYFLLYKRKEKKILAEKWATSIFYPFYALFGSPLFRKHRSASLILSSRERKTGSRGRRGNNTVFPPPPRLHSSGKTYLPRLCHLPKDKTGATETHTAPASSLFVFLYSFMISFQK